MTVTELITRLSLLPGHRNVKGLSYHGEVVDVSDVDEALVSEGSIVYEGDDFDGLAVPVVFLFTE